MAPSHLSVREMREDEKPLVLEMLKVRAVRGWAPVSLGAGQQSEWLQPPLEAEPAQSLGEAASVLSHFWPGPFSLRCLLPSLGVRKGCGGCHHLPHTLQAPGASALYPSSPAPGSSLAAQSMPIFWPGGSLPSWASLSLPWCLPPVLLNWVTPELLSHSLPPSLRVQMWRALASRAAAVLALPVPLPQSHHTAFLSPLGTPTLDPSWTGSGSSPSPWCPRGP